MQHLHRDVSPLDEHRAPLLNVDIDAGEPLDAGHFPQSDLPAFSDHTHDGPKVPAKTASATRSVHSTDMPITPSDCNTRANSRPSSISSGSALPSNQPTATPWRPYTLRPWYLWSLPVLSLILSWIVFGLYRLSVKNYGLGAEESAMVGWKFVPTLLAVAYTQLLRMLFNDLDRTEALSRLEISSTTGASPWETILRTPQSWWHILLCAPRKRLVRHSWPLTLTCALHVISILAISPLSSLLLSSEVVQLPRSTELNRLVPNKDAPLSFQGDRTIYFRTIGSILQNVATSAWITDDYVVLPFWPVGSSGLPWQNPTVSEAQTWQGETTVLHLDYKCEELNLSDTRLRTFQIPKEMVIIKDEDQGHILSATLRSSSGCEYSFEFNLVQTEMNSSASGFASWSDINHIATEYQFLDQVPESLYLYGPSAAVSFQPNVSEECYGNEALLLSSSWMDGWTADNFAKPTMHGYTCQSIHTVAKIPVTASISGSAFDVKFEESDFQQAKEPLQGPAWNISALHELYTDPYWYTYIPSNETFGGLSALLATQFGGKLEDMLTSDDVLDQATRIRRRIFGEAIRSALSRSESAGKDSIQGTVNILERRILVNFETAITLCVFLSVASIFLALTAWLSSSRKRPLGVATDPSAFLGAASLIASSSPKLLASLQDIDSNPKAGLGSCNYYTHGNTLHSLQLKARASIFNENRKPSWFLNRKNSKPNSPISDEKRKPSWFLNRMSSKPKPIQELQHPAYRLRNVLALFTGLVFVLIAIGVLYELATSSRLDSTLFVYQATVKVAGRLGSFAPFSIFPTAVGIAVSLWWDSLDFALRTHQPIMSMKTASTRASEGLASTYQSTYWVWATIKASLNGHWLLALVTFGTFLAQVFIVAMSALFDREGTTNLTPIELNRTLELRQIPHLQLVEFDYPPSINLHSHMGDPVYASVSQMFNDLSTNWIYSAVFDLTLSSSDPAWSYDGWGLVPVDIPDLQGYMKKQNIGSASGPQNALVIQSSNITVSTSALRGRTECTLVEGLDNHSMWLSENTGDSNPEYTLEQSFSLFLNSKYDRTSIAPSSYMLECCTNHSSTPQIHILNSTTESSNGTLIEIPVTPLVVGYWSKNRGDSKYSGFTPLEISAGNFTTKFIAGKGGFKPTRVDYGTPPDLLFFTDEVEMRALNCMPIIEASDVEVEVDIKTGKIYSFKTLNEPRVVEEAWTDPFLLRNRSNPSDPIQFIGNSNYSALQNLTSSYGNIFLKSLLYAADRSGLGLPFASASNSRREGLTDNVFNVRDNQTGLNLDFMSYAAYVAAGEDPEVLLNGTFLLEQTQMIFTKFFQHFVSLNVDFERGGWAFQPIGANMDDIGPVANRYIGGSNFTPPTAYQQMNKDRTAKAMLSTRVEVLEMDPAATWLSIAILIYLCLTALVVAATQRHYLGSLGTNLESMADMLVLVAGSDKLLRLIREKGPDALKKGGIYTKLDWFKGEDGKLRHVIEISEPPPKKNAERRHGYEMISLHETFRRKK